MTDRIDLDEVDAGDEGASADEGPNRGDWFWAETGIPDEEPESRREEDGGDDARDDRGPIPHVPRKTKDKPVGVPVESGGAGAGPGHDRGGVSGTEPSADGATSPSSTSDASDAADADDMTLAFSFDAVERLATPQAAVADAATWSDWTGIVGDVPAHVIQTFQREHHVDVDFFNGSGTGPAERLAKIDHNSMFYAERMVLVGVDGDETIAEAADWEFVPLVEAAEKADWELTPESG